MHQWSNFLHTLAKGCTKVRASDKLEEQVTIFKLISY